jgi:integrase/recombinase XerC
MSDLAISDPIAPVLSAFLASNSKRTQAAYAHDLSLFARWAGVETVADAARKLFASNGAGNLLAIEWKNAMLADGLASATISRRLSALRSLVKLANVSGVVPWTLYVPNVRIEARRDVTGPTWDTFQAIVAAEPSARVRALLALLGYSGLRIAEALSLTVEDVASDYQSVRTRRKGKREKCVVPVRGAASEALRAWLEERGRKPGPLFERMAYSWAHKLTVAAGARVGVRLAPHALRHAAVTRALDVTNGDVRSVRHFSAHAGVGVLLKYDDARGESVAGRIAGLVAGD